MAWYRKAARSGDKPALQRITPGIVESGSVEEQRELFALWLDRASEGDAEAERQIAAFFANGVGIERSQEQAAHWLSKAAVHDDETAPANNAAASHREPV
jgi:TPR repeat protein